jgi:hypothetical protein
MKKKTSETDVPKRVQKKKIPKEESLSNLSAILTDKKQEKYKKFVELVMKRIEGLE